MSNTNSFEKNYNSSILGIIYLLHYIVSLQSSYQITSLQDLEDLAKILISHWYRSFLLEGDLGVGKTSLTRYLVQELWWDITRVQSPTYSYFNTYTTNQGEFLHIDMYRLLDYETAFDKWLFEAIDAHDIVCIEWPKWTEQYRDSSWITLRFDFSWKDRIIHII